MKTQKYKIRFLGVMILLTMLASLMFPSSTVFADDPTPPADSSEVGDTPPEEEVASEAEAVLDEEPAEADSAAEESVAEDPAPEGEAEAEEESVLAQVPDGTDVVVLDEAGEIVPLVSQEAATAITTSDPIWCPDGVDPIPNTGGCSDRYDSLTELLANLTGASQPTQNGTIWIEMTYNSSTAEPGGTTNITIDGDNYTTWRNNSLTILGGWDGPGTNTATGTSLFSGDRFRIINWRNDLTVNNIVIDGGSGAPSLELEIDLSGNGSDANPAYNILLENVEVRNNTNNRGADINNDESPGSVTINNSTFTNNGTNNGDDGLYVRSRGNITLTNVTAGNANNTGNGNRGADLDNTAGNSSVGVTVTNSIFNDNNSDGLYIRSDGTITLTNVTAGNANNTGNGGNGADISNTSGNSSVSVIVTGSTFNDNNSDGLYIRSDGTITLTSVIAGTASNTGNGDDGVDLSNTSGSGSVEVRDSTFTYNSDEGLYATSDSDITLVNVTSNSNGGDGAYLDNSSGGGDDNIFVVKSVFSSNGDDGLEAHSNDDITLINVTAQGNNNDGAYLATSTSSGDMVTICGGLFTGQSGSGDYNVQVSGGNTRTRSSDLAPYTNWSGSWTNIANGTGACNFLDTDSDQVPDQWDTDDDNDGVLDTADSCPGTPAGQPVNADGCVVVYGCTDPTAFNYDPAANTDDGSCVAVILGCTDPTAFNYDPTANTDDGSCEEVVLGCTDLTAFNYDPAANTDDGSCIAAVLGCTDPTAFNYDPSANTDDGSCEEVVLGCTDPTAFNYDPAANTDDQSCIERVYGCTDPSAFNYDPLANTDDESCEEVVLGCTDESASNYDPFANTDDSSCIWPTVGGSGTPGSPTFSIPVTGTCDPFSVEEEYTDNDLGIIALLNNLCNYEVSLDVVPAGIPVEVEHISSLEINLTLLLGNTVITQLPEGTSMQLFFEIPADLAGHDFVVMYWDPSAKNGEGDWVELETTVENGQAVVLLTSGSPVIFPASFALVDKTATEGAYEPSTLTWVNDLTVAVTQWFASLGW